MADNKLVKSIIDAATITGLVAGIGFLGRKIIKEDLTKDPSANLMNFIKFTAVMAGQHCPEEVSRGPEDNPNVSAFIYNGDCRYHGWRGRS